VGHKDVAASLDKYLKAVKYSEKAVILGVRPDRASSWDDVRTVSLNKGSVDLYLLVSNKAKNLGDRVAAFFDTVESSAPKQTSATSLLVHLGQALTFGAYVSAVFDTSESSKPLEQR